MSTPATGPIDAGPMFMGLPRPALVIIGVEFAERLGYYAVAFSLFTYGRHMLSISTTGMQAIMNALYIVVPLAAGLASGLADGTWGRAKTLMLFLIAYACGLGVLTISSLPALFADFPLDPRGLSHFCFAVALLLFAVGYGGMKVCTNPMMADSIIAAYRTPTPTTEVRSNGVEALTVLCSTLETDKHKHTERGSRAYGTLPSPSSSAQATAANGTRREGEEDSGQSNKTESSGSSDNSNHRSRERETDFPSPVPPSPPSSSSSSPPHPAMLMEVLETRKEALERTLTRAFNYVYWVSNLGSLVGIFIAPLMRDLDSRRLAFGSVEYTTGYYFGFAMATISVVVGLVFFAQFRAYFPKNTPAPPFLFFRLVGRSVWYRLLFAVGCLHDAEFQSTVAREEGFLAYGLYGHHSFPLPSSSSPAVSSGHWHATGVTVFADTEKQRSEEETVTKKVSREAEEAVTVETTAAHHDPVWLEDCRVALRICRAFVALPIYWLISNQYSTSLMFSLEALNLPPSIPPEVFNSINTFTLLLFIAVSDCWLYPRFFEGRGRPTPSPRTRIVLGFLLIVVSMVWCGVVQNFIARRGTYVDAEGKYEVAEGEQKLAAGWLVFPYVLQGVAAALVDPASMEVAYTSAPTDMKGTVMALYWVASSLSGFLGLVLSPVMKPANGVGLYFGFALALLAVAGLFYKLNYTGAYANVATESLAAAVAAADDEEEHRERR